MFWFRITRILRIHVPMTVLDAVNRSILSGVADFLYPLRTLAFLFLVDVFFGMATSSFSVELDIWVWIRI